MNIEQEFARLNNHLAPQQPNEKPTAALLTLCSCILTLNDSVQQLIATLTPPAKPAPVPTPAPAKPAVTPAPATTPATPAKKV